RVERDSLSRQGQCFDGAFGADAILGRSGAQKVVVGLEVSSLALGALYFRCKQRGCNAANDTTCHLILQLENVLEIAVEPVDPDMDTIGSVDQLARDANPITGLADAALQNISHAELATDLPNVDGTAFVGE